MGKIEGGKAIKKYRKRMCWTQRRLAEEVGMTNQSIYLIESGQQVPRTGPNQNTLELLCKALQVEYGEIKKLYDDETK